MPFSSPYSDLTIPKTDVISYLFPAGYVPLDQPDSESNQSLSPRQLFQWVKRLAIDLDRLQVQPGKAVLIFNPNHIFVPIAHLGIFGSRRIVSGSNTGYTAPGEYPRALTLLYTETLIKTALTAVQESGVALCQIQFSKHENKPVLGVGNWRSMAGSALEVEAFTIQPMSAGEADRTMATVNYSSGTTGLPKGVCVGHANVIANAEKLIFMRFSCLRVKEITTIGWPLTDLSCVWAIIRHYNRHEDSHSDVHHGPFSFREASGRDSKYSITSFHVAATILVMLTGVEEL